MAERHLLARAPGARIVKGAGATPTNPGTREKTMQTAYEPSTREIQTAIDILESVSDLANHGSLRATIAHL